MTGDFEDNPIVDPTQLALFAQELASEDKNGNSPPANGNSEAKTEISSPFPSIPRKKKTLAQLAAEAQKETHSGKLVCPECACEDFRVTHTDVLDGYRKRLRRCRHCGYPVNTVEFVLRD